MIFFGGGEELAIISAVLSHFSRIWLLATPLTGAHQAPLSMGFLQARILGWVAMPSFMESSKTRDRTWVSYISCNGRQVLYHSCHLGSPIAFSLFSYCWVSLKSCLDLHLLHFRFHYRQRWYLSKSNLLDSLVLPNLVLYITRVYSFSYLLCI